LTKESKIYTGEKIAYSIFDVGKTGYLQLTELEKGAKNVLPQTLSSQ
jgi:hypothetical protein